MTIRMWFSGIAGVVLMTVFSWYTGALGVVELGRYGVYPPPESVVVEEDPLSGWAEVSLRDRAVAGAFVPLDAAPAPPRRERFHAGRLILTPRFTPVLRDFASLSPDEQPSNGAEASAGASVTEEDSATETPDGVAAAIAAAETYGEVRQAASESLILSITAFGLDALAEPVLTGEGVACTGPVDPARAEAEPAYALACIITELEATNLFAAVERDLLFEPAAAPAAVRGGSPPVAQMRDGPPRLPAPIVSTAERPSHPLLALQWHLASSGAVTDSARGGDTGFTAFLEAGPGLSREGVVVALLDTGLDLDHPDFRRSRALLTGADFISDAERGADGDGRDLDPTDPGLRCARSGAAARYHGSHTAGVLAAAPAARLLPVRVSTGCGALRSDLNDALRWAAGVAPMTFTLSDGETQTRHNGAPARIIVVPLTAHAPGGCARSTQDAVDAALAAGAIVVAAGGDGRIDARSASPGNCAGVLTVAASDAAGALAYYANYGPRVDVLAPGGDMRADVNGDGLPDGILSTRRSNPCVDVATGEPVGQCSYAYAAGSGKAAAHVGAALALLAGAYPEADAEELVALITNSAVRPRLPEQCPRACGSGLLDMSRAPLPGAGDVLDARRP